MANTEIVYSLIEKQYFVTMNIIAGLGFKLLIGSEYNTP